MAPKIPRGFGGAKQKDDKLGPSTERARPQKKDNSKEIPSTAEKRNLDIPSESNPVSRKKLRVGSASSTVENLIGSTAATYIGEKEIYSWQNMDAETEIHSMIQASSQLLIQSLGRAQRLQKESAYVSKLEADNKRFSEMVVENDNKWKKDLDAKEAAIEDLRRDLTESFEHRDLLNKSVDTLKAEKETLETKLNSLEAEKLKWSDDLQAAKDESFQSGFDFYLLGFMANDPDYDWEKKWGPGPAEDMANFKVDNAERIRLKRIELGLEEILEDAPSEQIPISDPLNAVPEGASLEDTQGASLDDTQGAS